MNKTVLYVGIFLVIIICCCISLVSAGVGISLYYTSSSSDSTSDTTTDSTATDTTATTADSTATKTTTVADTTVQDTTEIQLPLKPSNISMSSQYPFTYYVDGVIHEHTTRYGSDLAIDNDGETFASTQATANAWFKVILDKEIPILKIIVVNRVDCCQDRIVGSIIEIVNEKNTSVFKETISKSSASYTFTPKSGTNGKTITINRSSNDSILNIAEIKVYTTKSALTSYLNYNTDIKALNTSTEKVLPITADNITMSSTYLTFGKDKLVDNNDATFAHTNFGYNEWIRITLKKDVPISKVIIVNRKDCCKERILGSVLEIRNSQNVVTYYHRLFYKKDTYTIIPPLGVVGKTIILQSPAAPEIGMETVKQNGAVASKTTSTVSDQALNIAGIQIYSRTDVVNTY